MSDGFGAISELLEIARKLALNPDNAQLKDELRRYNDIDTITELCLRTENHAILDLLFPKLPDVILINIMLQRDNDIQQLIAKWIKDPKIRLEMFEEDLEPSVKIALIQPVMDEQPLKNIPNVIESETNPELRSFLIKYLDEKNDYLLLSQLGLGAEHIQPRIEASKKIVDQKVLAEIILQESNGEVRLAAITNLAVPHVANQLLRNDLYWKVRLASLHLVPTEDNLEYALEVDKSEEIRLYAAERIGNSELLAFTALHDASPQVRHMAIQRLVELKDQPTLVQVCTDDKILENRLLAIDGISHRQFLKIILDEIQESAIFTKAAGKVEDIDLLVDITKATNNLKLRKILLERLIELDATQTLFDMRSSMTGSLLEIIENYLYDNVD
ncbi:MAG: hypothetical protein ACXAE3_09735 [Candidatus Kariarchaeaceae archaeon]|jgi:hypothetical protein